MPRTALVTGAQGLLGSWLARALLERGDRVVALDRSRLPLGGLELQGIAQDVVRVAGDVTDAAAIEQVLDEHDVADVYHLAAQPLVGTGQRAPATTFEVNVRGTWVVLDACRLHSAERVLVASSENAYGPSDRLPYREDHPLAARYPYDASKAAADVIARCYWHSYGLPVAVTRFANLYGGGDLNASRLVPETVSAALDGRAPIIRSDGSPERDFLYVEDAVAGYLAIAEALGRGEGRGEAFNAGSGRSWPVREVVALICSIAGTDVEPDIRGTGTPSGELDRQWVDASRLRELTGWEPRFELEAGLRATVEWYRDHPEARVAAA